MTIITININVLKPCIKGQLIRVIIFFKLEFIKCIFLIKGVKRTKLMAGHQGKNPCSSRQEMVGASLREPWDGAGEKRSAKTCKREN